MWPLSSIFFLLYTSIPLQPLFPLTFFYISPFFLTSALSSFPHANQINSQLKPPSYWCISYIYILYEQSVSIFLLPQYHTFTQYCKPTHQKATQDNGSRQSTIVLIFNLEDNKGTMACMCKMFTVNMISHTTHYICTSMRNETTMFYPHYADMIIIKQ